MLSAEEHSLHQCNEVFWCPYSEYVQAPEIGKQQQHVWHYQSSEQVLSAVYQQGILLGGCSVLGRLEEEVMDNGFT